MSWLTTRAPSSLAVTVAALTVLAACSSVQVSPTPSAAASARATSTPSPRPEPSSTPAPTASPSPTPEPPEPLVLRITHESFASYWSATSLVTDGRLTSPSESGWQVRRLSPAGIDLLRSEVLATGLFTESADVPLVLVPDADITCTDGLGLTFTTAIELATDTGTVKVSWGRSHVARECHEPSTARDSLEALLTRLGTIDEWLPADGWNDPTLRAYQPDAFRLFTIAMPYRARHGRPPGIERVDWPLAGTLMTRGAALSSPEWAEDSRRCGTVSAGEAASVVEALANAGAPMTDSNSPGFASGTVLQDPSNGLTVAVVLEGMRPDETGCRSADLRFLNCWAIGGVDLFGCAVP